ncbi:MAG: hypothetical protein COU69_00495 [Candidatus Pacebacteria bacterium CG10_big_fil_rev_8_21_14_0_10_56_10]|nr:MAG: hypothetical protein COU69_00495 [Candidatus Pacebacteria bacterium CG10_big_fil_rev_8_21_14_0_10_56_10]
MEQSILTPDQQRILGQIYSAQAILEQFYLTGGTALSEFYFQHRLSEDLDFFSESKLQSRSLLEWATNTAGQLQAEVGYKSLHGQLTFLFKFPESEVKIDFAYYPFPHIGEFKKANNLKVASMIDIGVNKLQAIQTRKRGRDFVDLYFIIEKGELELDTLLKSFRNKFDMVVSKQEFAKQFTGVVEAADQPRFLENVEWSVIESFFFQKAKELSRDFLT